LVSSNMSELRSGLPAPSSSLVDALNLDPSLRSSAPQPQPQPQPQGQGGGGNVVQFPGNGSNSGRPSASEMVQYLADKGVQPHVAQGMVNRLTVESSLDPGAVGDDGHSFGLAQWKDSRAVGLLKYGQQTGRNPYDWRTQLDYGLHELQTTERGTNERLRLATNAGEAQQIFTDGFERPAATHEQLQRAARGNFNEPAQQFVDGLFDQMRQARTQYDREIKAAQEPRELERLLARRYLLESNQPPQNAHSAWQQWSGLATVLALFGGVFGRQHMNASLNAAAGMLEGANQADSQAYDKNYRQWKDHLDLGMKAIELMNREAREITEDSRKHYDQQLAELQTLAAMHQLPGKYAHEEVQRQLDQLNLMKTNRDLLEKQNVDSDIRLSFEEKDRAWLEAHPEAHGVIPADIRARHHGEAEREYKGTGGAFQILTDPTTNQQYRYNPTTGEATTLDMQPYAPGGATKIGAGAGKQGETKEIEQVKPDGSSRSGAAYRTGTNWFWAGTGEPVEGSFNFKSVGRPRSAPAEYIDALKKENPNITSDEISHANALFRADSAFAAGPEGRNVNALNTLAGHLPLFEKYARALQTGDVRVINRMLQSLSEQSGHPEITNYDLAQEFISDETVKVLVSGSGAGALADREALKSKLRAAMSQAQFGGAADVIKDFVGGKLGSLRQTYSRGDPKLADYFNTRLLTPDALRLFDSEKPGGTSGGGSPAPPIARPETSRQGQAAAPPASPVLRYDAQGNRVQ
jgi:hypothetical protein